MRAVRMTFRSDGSLKPAVSQLRLRSCGWQVAHGTDVSARLDVMR